MRRNCLILPPFLYLSLALLAFACCDASSVPTVTITTSSGERLVVQVEIADSAAERARGLMFREDLPEGEGMLFLFPEETQTSFWMKNTPISLDLIFIRERRIVDLIENAVPYSEELLTPDSPYTKVLEVPGGYVTRNGIQEGDLIESP